jgi:predicted enzyme related to lactoylglutathione lyase
LPEMTSYRPGAPCWVDTASADPQQSAEFYTALFDWEATETMPPGSEGSYLMFRKDGKDVAAAGSKPDPSFPTVWNTYVATDDADASAARIRDAGGTVVMEPFDVFTAGRMAVAQDPQGAHFAVWQANDMHGAQLVTEPGTFCWNELVTTDSEAATAFYRDVFGWESETLQQGDGPPYHMQKVGGDAVAGIMDRLPDMSDIPPHWMVYFAVEDVDRTAELARERAGQLLAGPMDSPYGRFAVVQDPLGAVFSAIKLSPPSE